MSYRNVNPAGHREGVYMSYRNEDSTSIVIDQLSAMIVIELRALSSEQYKPGPAMSIDLTTTTVLMKKRVKELRRIREEIETLMTGALE